MILETVTVTEGDEIMLPKSIREKLGITSGQKLQMFVYQEQIRLVPIVPAQQLRGFVKGIDTTVEREPDRL